MSHHAQRQRIFLCLLAALIVVLCAAIASPQPLLAQDGTVPPIHLNVLGTYATGIYDEGAAEIVSYDPATQRAFVIDGGNATIDILDISDPSAPTLVTHVTQQHLWQEGRRFSIFVAREMLAAKQQGRALI